MSITDKLSVSNYAFTKYVKKIKRLIDQGVANEESFYPAFVYLLENYFDSNEFEVVAVPKTESGEDKPDFIVYMDNVPIISIEAKNPNDPIDQWLKQESSNRLFEQVYRYRGGESGDMPVLVTDFIHIWVIDKDKPNSLHTDHPVKHKFKIIDDSETMWKTYRGATTKFEKALTYLSEDVVISIEKVSSMIDHLVTYAKKLKEKIMETFEDTESPMKTYLKGIRNDFLKSIFSKDKRKKSKEFADLFAQTLIYGGFVAWMRFCRERNNPKNFSFNSATQYLPYGTFTYNIFANLSVNLSPEVQNTIIQKIEKVFRSSEFEKITEDTETLMITFYSDFLRKYDPELAKDRGIVYTPQPIINFIVRGVDHFLQKSFDRSDGLTSSDVRFLDPAAGTMGFPCEILREAKKDFSKQFSNQPSRARNEFNTWIHDTFLDNTYAFEILMAPYVLGHLRTNMVINELGADFDPAEERVNLYLFNTLMDLQTTIEDFRNPTIGEEIVKALNIRNRKDILVVLSNPPYNVSSQNKFDWIENKIEDYKKNIQREGTKKITGLTSLQDDYVKFIRFAQWKVKQNDYGIVGFITNNYYIDGLQFRGMRASLQKDFDKIWVVDLHGNARKSIPFSIKEKGITTDENVFGITVGVAIVFLIRTPNHSDEECEVKYVDKWGKKAEKFEFLEKSIEKIEFQDVSERLDYELCPDKFDKRDRYMKFPYLLDIFKQNISGIKTGHDHEIMGMTETETKEKIKKLFEKYSDPPNKPNVSWNPVSIADTSRKEGLESIIEWNWRGFDRRYISYNPILMQSHRFSIMQYLLPEQDNISLMVNRQSSVGKGGSSVLITDTVFDNKCAEGASGLHSYAFPLKIYDPQEAKEEKDKYLENSKFYKLDIEDYKPKKAKHSNIKKEFKTRLEYGDLISDKEILYYIYGILHSPTYRDRYHLGLKEDYPRVPFLTEKDLFLKMAKLGKRLADLHLFRANDIDPTQFPMSESTDYKVYYVRRNDKDDQGNQIPDTYDPVTQKIYFEKRTKTQKKKEREGDPLNEITWIGGITQEMWDFQIGGRQQLKRWLYPRRYSEEDKRKTISRPLTNDEMEYFLKMCDVIKKTIALRPKLDEIYKKIDKTE